MNTLIATRRPVIRASASVLPTTAFPAVLLLIGLMFSSADATAQGVIYESFRPVVPMTVAPYVANYTPSGNYAAVTAFSPPVAPYAAAPVAVTSSFAPAVATAVPVTSFYAPVTAGYAPTTTYYAPAAVSYAPAVAAPVTTYYAPAAVAVPVYRRGLFGGYRPVRAAWYMPGYSY